jgi:2-oxoglutarate dehydrogenase E2 component (dihydrolipoamide succinyltransferase)
MGEIQLLLPKMGESVIEATILTWHKKVGEKIEENEILVEVATDKVDTDVPSNVTGVIKALLYNVGDVVAIGNPLAIIEVEGITSNLPQQDDAKIEEPIAIPDKTESSIKTEEIVVEKAVENIQQEIKVAEKIISPTHISEVSTTNGQYYSPLVLNIARVESISMTELEKIIGSGIEGRVTKDDVLAYLELRKNKKVEVKEEPKAIVQENTIIPPKKLELENNISNNNEIIEMDRMRKLIAKNMVDSKRISAHVSSFVEVDVTNIVFWREKHKNTFKTKEGYNLSYMPIFVEAIAKAINDFPMINISVNGETIIKKKDINIGIATALPTGNLIVPVIKNADRLSLLGLAESINDLALRARSNALKTNDIEGGTYTISNIGTFGNIIGTPIIPQPQVAIMAVGSITKKPVVIESQHGDMIAIRHMMYLSHTYDHRVVDGALGGMFVKRVADYLLNFDQERKLY